MVIDNDYVFSVNLYHLVRLPGDVGARDGEGAAARHGNVGQVQTYLEMGQTSGYDIKLVSQKE